MAKTEPKAAGGEEQSMEEILQSIRRIIAEDGEDASSTVPQNEPESAAPSVVPDEADVLELTDMVTESGAVVSLGEPEKAVEIDFDEPVAVTPSPAPETKPGGDVLKNIDAMIGSERLAEVTAQANAPAATDEDSLLSSSAAQAAAQAFRSIKKGDVAPQAVDSMPFRSGTTVEDLMMELLRPMLKTWLDSNLPPLVERIVEREVRKLTQ